MARIERLLREAKQVLLTDGKRFNLDATGAKNMSDIKRKLRIHGALYRKRSSMTYLVYGLRHSAGYEVRIDFIF